MAAEKRRAANVGVSRRAVRSHLLDFGFAGGRISVEKSAASVRSLEK